MLYVGRRNPKEKTQKINGVIVNKNDSCIGNTKIHFKIRDNLTFSISIG
jgi:hypothetical protein